MKLPDGSKVLMNEGSVHGYRDSFRQHVRGVTLTGEAYFDVQPNATKQFIVRSGKVTTSVHASLTPAPKAPAGKQDDKSSGVSI